MFSQEFLELVLNFGVGWAHFTTKLSANSQNSRENTTIFIDCFRRENSLINTPELINQISDVFAGNFGYICNFVVKWAHFTTKLSANSQNSCENITNFIYCFRGNN